MTRYGIKITYSNGDEEDGLYGNFSMHANTKLICIMT